MQIVKGSSADVVEVYVKDLSKDGRFLPVITGIDARFSVQVAGDRMYALTNWNAPNGRIVAFDLTNPAPANWKEIVPERKSVLDGFSLAGGKLTASWLENVHSHIEVFTADGKPVREIKLPGLG